MNWRNTVLIHIPHSSTVIPEKYQPDFLLDDNELKQEIRTMTDHYVEDLFAVPGIMTHINPVSRLVMDPERFRDDNDELMSKKGMGFAYTQTSDGKPLKTLTHLDKSRILHELYDPYHEELTRKTASILSARGQCLIIDAHSFPSIPLPYEDTSANQQSLRPGICLGYETYHMNQILLDKAIVYFKTHCGLSVALNIPFAGSIVPAQYYHKDSRVISLMIEINRALYMDEKTGERSSEYSRVKEWITGFFSSVIGI